jgi:hypothetical protein
MTEIMPMNLPPSTFLSHCSILECVYREATILTSNRPTGQDIDYRGLAKMPGDLDRQSSKKVFCGLGHLKQATISSNEQGTPSHKRKEVLVAFSRTRIRYQTLTGCSTHSNP